VDDELIERSLAEDVGAGDVTSEVTMPATARAVATITQKAPGVISGLDVAEAVLEEAAVHHLDAWTPHITHDPDAAPVLAALRERGLPPLAGSQIPTNSLR